MVYETTMRSSSVALLQQALDLEAKGLKAEALNSIQALAPRRVIPSDIALLESTGYFKWLKRERGIRGADEVLNFFSKAKELFPHYMPLWHYTMECSVVHYNLEVSEEVLWNHANHLLLLIHWNHFVAWHDLGEQYLYSNTSLGSLKSSLRSSAHPQSELVKGKILCSSAKEFLLEPWILVQLPSKPVLLHQWLVTALAETIKFEKQIAEFYCVKFPVSYEPTILELSRLQQTLKSGLLEGFKFLSLVTMDNLPPDRPLRRAIKGMLPVLDFITDGQTSAIIKDLKALVWSGRASDEEFTKLPREDVEQCLGNMYSIRMWLSEKKNFHLFRDKSSRSAQFAVKTKISNSCHKPVEEIIKFMISGTYKEYVSLVLETKKPPVPEDLAMSVELFMAFQLSEELQRSSSLHQGTSPIFDVMMQDTERGGVLIALQLLQNYATATKSSLNFVDSKGDNFDVDKFKSVFMEAGKKKRKWRFSSIIANLTEQLASQENNLKEGLFEFVHNLEVRIKKVALRMAESKLSRTPQSLKLVDLGEWDVVQFVLPCLVVSLSRLHQDDSIDELPKKWFLKFVDELIHSFESDKCFTTLRPSRHPSAFFQATNKTPYWNLATRWSTVKRRIPFPCVQAKLAKLDKLITLMCDHTGSGTALLLAWRLIWRVEFVLDKVSGHLRTANEDLKNLEVTCLHMAYCARYNLEYHKLEPGHPELMATMIFNICCSNFKDVRFSRLIKMNPGLPSNLTRNFEAEAELLSDQEVFGVIVYILVNYSEHWKHKNPDIIPTPSPFDPVLSAVYWYETEDWWRLKQIISGWFKSGRGDDSSMVSYEFAKDFPVLYSIALHNIRDNKVVMQHPGEITFCPIKHCRWCGTVESTEFRVCDFCKEDPSYADTNIFCSEACELEAREMHLEEHVRAEMIIVGLSN